MTWSSVAVPRPESCDSSVPMLSVARRVEKTPCKVVDLKSNVILVGRSPFLYLVCNKAPRASSKQGMLTFNVGGSGLFRGLKSSGPWSIPGLEW